MDDDRHFVLHEIERALRLCRAARSRLDGEPAKAYNSGYEEALVYLLGLFQDEWEIEE